MKIVSWNVNGLRAIHRRNQFLPYLEEYSPDILCVQETKAHPEQLDDILHAPTGYTFVGFHSCSIKKGYSGVATYSKVKPDEHGTGFGIEKFDQEGRVMQTRFGSTVLFNVYFPNGGQGDERIAYKLDFYDALFAHCKRLEDEGKDVIVCGDYNTAHTEDDLARPKQNIKTSGFLPHERVKIDEIIAMGYTDTFRLFTEGNGNYTWWSYQQTARERNVGWRIDYHFVSQGLTSKVKAGYIQPDVLGSDHCPVVLEIDA
jgi:exodeoxyribonuclease-3